MRRFTAFLLGGSLLLVLPSPADAQQLRAGAVDLEFDGRVQIQFNSTSVDETDLSVTGEPLELPFTTFETRRVRLTANLEIEDWLRAKIQPDFALGRLSLKDAWVEYGVADGTRLRVGQFKKPFSRIELTSSTTLPVIEHALRIRGLEAAYGARNRMLPETRPLTEVGGGLLLGDEQALLGTLGYLGRDIGAALQGAAGRFGYAVGVFNGSGADARDLNDGKSVAGRLEYRPGELPLVLGLAGGYAERRLQGEVDGRILTQPSGDGIAVELDAEWGEFRRAGLHLLLELTAGENYLGRVLADPVIGGRLVDERFLGAQAIAAWFRPLTGGRIEGVEPAGRIGFADPNRARAGDHGWLLTPGLNVYFLGRNRLMLNWDVFVPGGDAFETEHAIRAQAQAHF